MVDNVVQFMVDIARVGVILCQDMGGDSRMEVMLLLPRNTAPWSYLVSSPCLITTGGQ